MREVWKEPFLTELMCLVVHCPGRRSTFVCTEIRPDLELCGQSYQHVAAQVISSPVQSAYQWRQMCFVMFPCSCKLYQ